ncbi:MAG: nitrate reductase cytochrome c-type subunit [Rhodocyclaceae bacterium]
MKTAFKITAGFAIVTLIASIVGCASTAGPTTMRGAAVDAPDRAPTVKIYSEKMPGVGEPRLIARSFIGQPPMVSHTIEQYVPMTMEENACLDCHITVELRGQKVPQMSASHFSTSLKRKDGSPQLSMDRYQCDSCHVPQADAKPLVDSKFVGVTQ